MALARRQSALEAYERERRMGGIAALVRLVHLGAHPGLRIVVDGDNAVADRHPAGAGDFHQPARGFERHDLEMDRIAPDDTAERHRALIGLAGALGGVERDGDRGWYLERARDGEAVVDRTGGI